jgi:hypothetical protein
MQSCAVLGGEDDDRQKVWALIPDRRLFITNWSVPEDHCGQ